jgi:hypothetical protein
MHLTRTSRARIAASWASLRNATDFSIDMALRLIAESRELRRRSREIRNHALAVRVRALVMLPDEPNDPDALEVALMILRLQRAGWSLGDTAFNSPEGRLWVVSGHNGENLIRAQGRTELEA